MGSSADSPPALGDDGGDLAFAIGRVVREARQRAGLTLQQLASATDLSQPFISQIENGRSMPSLLSLHRLAGALGTSAHACCWRRRLRRGEHRARQRGSALRAHRHRRRGHRAAHRGRRLQTPRAHVVAAAHARQTEYLQHDDDEIFYIVSGTLEIELGAARTETLQPGDTITFDANIPHRWRAAGRKACTFIIVATPGRF